jgi:hypothetical protein
MTLEDRPNTVASTYFDASTGTDLATTIVYAVAEAEDVPPEALGGPPLYDQVDPDGLERALFHERAESARDRTATFPYRGYRVRVRGDGRVAVVERGGA